MKIELTEAHYKDIEDGLMASLTSMGNDPHSDYHERSVARIINETERKCTFHTGPLWSDEDKGPRDMAGFNVWISCRDVIEKDGKRFRRRWKNAVGIFLDVLDVPGVHRMCREMVRMMVDWSNEFIDDYPEDGLEPMDAK